MTPRSQSGAGPHQDDVDAVRALLDATEDFPDNDLRARYLLSSDWLRDRGAAAAARLAPGRRRGRERDASPTAQPAATPTGALLRTEEVSERTGIAINTLRYWRKNGQGPRFIRMGRRLVCREVDLEAWIRAEFSEDGR